MIPEFTIGADPEVFLRNANEYVSAQDIVPGTKERPAQMEGLPEGFMIQADNVACEFNIPPAKNAIAFDRNISLALNYVKIYARKRKLKIDLSAAAIFPEEILNDPRIRILGCDSDVNAWTLQDNVPPKNANSTLRTIGGHVHVGWDEPNFKNKVKFVRAFDVYVTLPSILRTKKTDRRKFYGAAGAFRPKKYGVECRSPEPAWIMSKRERSLVYAGVCKAFNIVYEQPAMVEAINEHAEVICEAINEHNVDLAKYLVSCFS